MLNSPPEEGIPVIRRLHNSPRVMFANTFVNDNIHNSPITLDTSSNRGESSPTDSLSSSDEYGFMRDVASDKGSAKSTPVDKFTPNNKFNNNNNNNKGSNKDNDIPYEVSPSNVFCVTPAKAYIDVDSSSIGIATPLIQSNTTSTIDINIDLNYLYENILPIMMISALMFLLILKASVEYNVFNFTNNDINTNIPSSSTSSSSTLKVVFQSFPLTTASNSIQALSNTVTTATAMALATSTIVEHTIKSVVSVLLTTITSIVKNIHAVSLSLSQHTTNVLRKIKFNTNKLTSTSSIAMTSATTTTASIVSTSAKHIVLMTTSASRKVGSTLKNIKL
jgi:hypothetical protein